MKPIRNYSKIIQNLKEEKRDLEYEQGKIKAEVGSIEKRISALAEMNQHFERSIAKVNQEILDSESKKENVMEKAAKGVLNISDHARLRWLERNYNTAYEGAMNLLEEKLSRVAMINGRMPLVNGLVAVIKNGVVVTIK